MTSGYCDSLADFMRSCPTYQDGIVDNPYSSVFSRVGNNVYQCRDGFGAKYELPHSGGGRYATLGDVRNIFNVGIEHGIRKAYGIKSKWDKDFCAAIGGYPKGSIIYTDSGKRMISRKGNNTSQIPEDGTTDANWTEDNATPRFGNGYDLWSSIKMLPGVVLPQEETTTWMLIATIEPSQSRGIGFDNLTFTYNAHFGTSDGYLVTLPLCYAGHMSLKVSPYADIYTNDKHETDYIEVLSATRYELPYRTYTNYKGQEVEMTLPKVIKAPQKTIPLSRDKTHYIFIEYENGCMYPYDNDYGRLSEGKSGSLVVYATQLILNWPAI